jgi:hypothetical protein
MKFFFGSIIGLMLIGLLYFIVGSMHVTFINENWVAIALGFGFALFYVITGFISFSIALKKDIKFFNKIVVISVISRLIFILSAITLVFKFSTVDKISFILSIFICYFIFQIFEIVTFNRIGLGKI